VFLVRAAVAVALIVLLAFTPLLAADPAGIGTERPAYAAPSSQNKNDNDDNGNRNNNDNGSGEDNDNDDEGDDEGDDERPAPSAPVSAPARSGPAQAACSTPGQETSFTSQDGRVTVRVFANAPRALRLTVVMPLDAGVTPAPPGPVVGGLLFQVIAEECGGGPIPVLPTEANLGARYSDADAAGLNEQAFTIARLDTNTNQWRPVEKQAADPANNFASATIADLGYYVVYQR
jgi:hypothetical protein